MANNTIKLSYRLSDKNRLSIVRPDLCKEWNYAKNHPLRPEDVCCSAGQRVWWICNKGHEWEATLTNRNQGRNCPYCSGRKVNKSNSLNTMNASVSKEWHPTKNKELTPNDVACYSNKKVWWLCKNGHEWETTISSRTGGNNCPHCFYLKMHLKQSAKKKIKANTKLYLEDYLKRNLQTLFPNIAKEWHPTKNGDIKPDTIMAKSGKRAWWICDKGHEWEATVCGRVVTKTKCPYCSRKLVTKENSLSITNPELIRMWNYNKNGNLLPTDVLSGSTKKVWWICNKGHEWKASILSRKNGNGCPFCAGQKVCKDNCLSTLNSFLSKEWDYNKNKKITPNDVTANSGKKAWWLCKNGHSWLATIGARNKKGYECPKCNGVNLKDGTHCDSYPEAYYYLILKSKNIEFKHHQKYGNKFGKIIYDFFIIKENKYIEITSYNEKNCRWWNKYHDKIQKKKKIAEEKLNASFEFIQLELSQEQKEMVKQNSDFYNTLTN